MKLEDTIFSNYKLVIDEFDIPVGIQINGNIRYWLYDVVKITFDSRGYITEGINHEGIGKIVQIRRDTSDYFFGVLMNNREFGYVKSLRISKVCES